MTVADIIKELSLTVFNEGDTSIEVSGGYTSDLLSDVMGNADEACIWITLQTHRNVAAIATLKEVGAVLLVKGLEPDANTLEHAQEEDITILGTSKETFEITGALFQLLK